MYQQYPAVLQDKEYKYRVHQLSNGSWQIERAEKPRHNMGIGILNDYNHWEYFMVVESKEEADKVVALAQNKPKYIYY